MNQFENIFFMMYILIGITVMQFMGVDNVFNACSLEIGLDKDMPRHKKNLLFSFYIILFILLWPFVLLEWFSNH